MSRNDSKAVSEGNDGPVPLQEEFGSGQLTLVDVYRVFKERFDQSDRYWYSMRSCFDQQVKKLDELMEMTRRASQRLVNLEYDARQPHLAIEAKQTPRLASVARAPLQQFKRCMEIAVLQTGFVPTRFVLPASVMTAPDLRHSLVQGRVPW